MAQTDRQGVNLLTAWRSCHEVSRNVQRYFGWRIIVGDATNRLTKDLWACDVCVDELVGASQQFDVSSLYDDDAENQHSDLIYLNLLLCSPWKLSRLSHTKSFSLPVTSASTRKAPPWPTS